MEQHGQRHRAAMGRVQFYTLLGAGAVTFGVGTALTVGSGIAHADSSTAGNRPASSAAEAAEGQTRGPTRMNANASRIHSSITESRVKSSGNPAAPAATTSISSLRLSLNPAIRTAASADSAGDQIAKSGRPPVEVAESRAKAVVGAIQTVTAAASVRNPVAIPTTGLSDEASATSAITPKDTIDIAFSGLNGSIGWIPVVGTAINGVKFALDSVSLATSVITLDLPQAVTELGNLFVDVIGLAPVVGAPIASLLSQTVLGVNAKLGIFVQEGLQNFLVSESTWSRYQLNVDTVDVSTGLGGLQAATATVSKPNYSGVPVIVEVTNTGFQVGWSVPLEGRLQLLALAFS